MLFLSLSWFMIRGPSPVEPVGLGRQNYEIIRIPPIIFGRIQDSFTNETSVVRRKPVPLNNGG